MFAMAILALVLLLAIGVPIYLVLIGTATVLLLVEGKSVAGLGQHILDHLNSPILVSVPFFLLAAVLMRGGGIARILFGAARTWIGWLPGGWRYRAWPRPRFSQRSPDHRRPPRWRWARCWCR